MSGPSSVVRETISFVLGWETTVALDTTVVGNLVLQHSVEESVALRHTPEEMKTPVNVFIATFTSVSVVTILLSLSASVSGTH